MITITTQRILFLFQLVLGILSAGSIPLLANSSPYYVGENLIVPTHMNLFFQDTPIKEVQGSIPGTGAGTNLVSLDLRGAWNANENLTLRGSIPFYFATKDLTGQAKSSVGNFNFGGAYVWNFESMDHAWSYGPAISGDIFLPTSRKAQGAVVAAANPTTDFYKYFSKATAFTPTVGFFVRSDWFAFKVNLGYGGIFLAAPGVSGSSSKFRNLMNAQMGMTYALLPDLHLNVEYNSILLDSNTKSRVARGFSHHVYRHAVTPSVSGVWDDLMLSLFATMPLDKPTQNTTNVAFGLSLGMMF